LQFLIPSQATISTSIHILIPVHFVRSVATQVTHNIGIHLSIRLHLSIRYV